MMGTRRGAVLIASMEVQPQLLLHSIGQDNPMHASFAASSTA